MASWLSGWLADWLAGLLGWLGGLGWAGSFEALPEDAQVDFWRSGSRTKQQLQIDLTVSITSLRVEQEIKRKTAVQMG